MHILAQYSSSSSGTDYTPFIIVWVICGLIGAAIGSGKNLGCAGFMLGVLLGPIGIIVIAVMGNKPTSTLERIEARPEKRRLASRSVGPVRLAMVRRAAVDAVCRARRGGRDAAPA